MSSSKLQEQQVSDETVRYIIDRLMQDLTTKLLPIIKRGSRWSVECDHGGKPGEPARLKITEYVN